MKGVVKKGLIRAVSLGRLVALAAALGIVVSLCSGCGGGGKAPIITGITVSPSNVVNSGTTVTLTATVRDSTKLKQAVWSADGGTMAVDIGLKGTWIAPDVKENTTYTITLVATETTGLSDTQLVRVAVSPATTSTSGARITSLTAQSSVVKPGAEDTFTVTVANSSNLVDVSWSADYGSFVTNRGTTVKWLAPIDVQADQWVTINVVTTDTSGAADTAQLRVLVSGQGYSIITGFQVSGSGIVNQGDAVTVTVQTDDSTTVKSVKWTANGGIMSVDSGVTCRWIAPQGMAQNTVYVITATVTSQQGLVSQGSVSVVVKGTAT